MQCDPVDKLTYMEPNPTESALKRKAEAEAAQANGGADEWVIGFVVMIFNQ